MNNKNLQQIFDNYIRDFEIFNNTDDHEETYKWAVAKDFRKLMDEALSKDGQVFVETLKQARNATDNIIDNYTQPFHGLVEFAKKEPDTVKQMFIDLYVDDGNDLSKRAKKIERFFSKSDELLDKYVPGSYRYKQNSHSVSAYLFLYDPDNHYMYKAMQATEFAGCIDYCDSWGSGNNINLKVFYRMCDEVLEEINKNHELLAINETRFNGRFNRQREELHPDAKKHILLFDIIYCCSVYNLFKGITYSSLNAKQKQQRQMQINKANEALKKYRKAEAVMNELNAAFDCFEAKLHDGVKVISNEGGKVLSADKTYVNVEYENGLVKKKSFYGALDSQTISLDYDKFDEDFCKYRELIHSRNSIIGVMNFAETELAQYDEDWTGV